MPAAEQSVFWPKSRMVTTSCVHISRCCSYQQPPSYLKSDSSDSDPSCYGVQSQGGPAQVGGGGGGAGQLLGAGQPGRCGRQPRRPAGAAPGHWHQGGHLRWTRIDIVVGVQNMLVEAGNACTTTLHQNCVQTQCFLVAASIISARRCMSCCRQLKCGGFHAWCWIQAVRHM